MQQNVQLFLNDQQADLDNDNPIALTFQINNLADPKNQAGNTSNQFKLPITQNNRRICGFPDDIRFTNNIPYTQLKAVLVINGIEVIPLGIGEINSADKQYIAITILSGNVDFFDNIAGQIYEMGDKTTKSGIDSPFLPYTHTWDLPTVVASRKNTEGYIYPLIDYGGLNPLAPYSVDVRLLRPAFFLKTAIALIVKAAGYTATGSLLSDPLYNSILIPFANDSFEHGTDYQVQPDLLGLIAYTNRDQSATQIEYNVGNLGDISFGTVTSDPNTQFDGVHFVSKSIFSADIIVTIPKFYFMGRLQRGYESSVDIQILVSTPDGDLVVSSQNYDLSAGFTRVAGTSGANERGYTTILNQTLSGSVDFQPGYSLRIVYKFYNGRPEAFTMYAGASIQIKANNQQVIYGQQVQAERIFPDISQVDFLKDTLQRHAIICQSDNTNRTVTFSSLKDIVKNIPIAKNWSKKCLNVGKQNNFVLSQNYAQVNNLKYKTDAAINDGLPGYADDVINIDDKTLSTTPYDMIQSQFAPSLQVPFAATTTAQILKHDVTQDSLDFTISTSPRVLVNQKFNLAAKGISITFNDNNGNTIVVNDEVSTPYFYKSDGAFSLMWQDQPNHPGLKSTYYKELQRILNRTKIVTRYFLLTPRDITELNLLIPIYLEQDAAYFYVNQIYQWQKGTACKVQLVKIGEI